MDLAKTRFVEQIGPHCPARHCEVPVVRCTDGRQDLLLDPTPSSGGEYKITDTGGQIPHARKLTNTQQFGMLGQLHSRHEPTCGHYRRWKREQR